MLFAPIYALLGLADQTIGEIRDCLARDRTSFQRVAFPYASLGDPGNFVYDKVRHLPAFQEIVRTLKADRDDLLERYSGL